MEADMPLVGKHEAHYINAAGYWLALLEVAQNLAFEKGTDEEGMVRCLAFSIVSGMVAKRFLTMRAL